MKNIIPLISEDLVIRMVRRLKGHDSGQIVTALEKTRLVEGLEIDKIMLRRLVCLMYLPIEEWSSEDRRWEAELDRAQKALMGVYSAKVRLEAIFAQLAVFDKNDDYRRLFLVSVAEMDWDAATTAAWYAFLRGGTPDR